jgi:DNA-directed RNA polymerase specialized sigma subunit
MRKKVYYNDPKKLDAMNSVESHEDRVIMQHDLDQFIKTLDDRERCVISIIKNCSDYMTDDEMAKKIGITRQTMYNVRMRIKDKYNKYFDYNDSKS